jgi:hypothetical protein
MAERGSILTVRKLPAIGQLFAISGHS